MKSLLLCALISLSSLTFANDFKDLKDAISDKIYKEFGSDQCEEGLYPGFDQCERNFVIADIEYALAFINHEASRFNLKVKVQAAITYYLGINHFDNVSAEYQCEGEAFKKEGKKVYLSSRFKCQ